MTITSVEDGRIVGSPATGYPDKTAEDWLPYEHYLRDDGKIVNQVGGFLVRAGDRLLIIDAGGGPQNSNAGGVEHSVDEHLREMFRLKGLTGAAIDGAVAVALSTSLECGELPDALAAAGVSPGDVTDVVFTHLHSDHIGWASADGEPFFPNAVYRCASADLEYFMGPDVDEAFSMLVWGTLSARDRLSPVLDRLVTWDRDCTIAPGVDVQIAPGHTPGSSVIVLSSGSQRALILGDMVHCPFELQDEQWQCIGDVDPALAKRTKAAYIRELEGGESLAAGSHFPGLRFGRLLPGEVRRGWVFT